MGGSVSGGCAFEPRCFRAAEVGDGRERCRSEAPGETVHGVHTWRCWHPLAAEPVTNLVIDTAYQGWEAEAAANAAGSPERTVDHG